MNQNENPGMRVYHVVVSSTPINRRPQPDGSIPDEVRWSYFVESEAPMGMRLADRIRDMALADMDLHGRTLCVEKVELVSGPPATDHEVVREQLAALPSEIIDSIRVEAQLRNQIQHLAGRVKDMGAQLRAQQEYTRNRELEAAAEIERLSCTIDTLTTENGMLIMELGEIRAENQQLCYERQLLGQARRILDEAAADLGGGRLASRVEDMSQRIVDEIGHPATDEPALGPNLRILRDLTADLLHRIDEDRTADWMVTRDRDREREPSMSKLLNQIAALVAGTQDREVDV